MNFKAVLITAWIWFPALATAYDTRSGAFRVCNSPECIQRAELINEALNTSIDPCTDFYSYVCGRWESNHLPSGRGSYDIYQEIRKDIPDTRSYILGNRTWVESNQTIIDKVATMYNACLALPDASDALFRVLNESGFNSWPILTEDKIFSNCTDLLRQMDISVIIYLVSAKKTLYARKPVNDYELCIKPENVPEKLKGMKDQEIKAVINSTINLLYPGTASSNIEKLTNELVYFARKLWSIWHGFTRKLSVSQLENDFGSNIPLSVLLKRELVKVNITLNETENVEVSYYYFQELIKVLNTTNPNTLYNYAGFLALFPYLEYVQMSNESELKSRSRSECITLLEKSAPDVLDYLYITNEPNHTAIKNEVEDIARRLIQVFNETIQNTSWIDNNTRKAFEEVLKAPLRLVYPDALLNMSVLEALYKYVPCFPSNISFTEALYYFQENSYKMNLRKFRHPEESNWRWNYSPREFRSKFQEKFGVNIEIPYPIFVSPLFQRGLPRSLNYGGIGGTIARELGSTFSVNGIKNINRQHRQILTQDLVNLFDNNTLCFEQQYKIANTEFLQEHQMHGEVQEKWAGTDQALADNTGLQMAFKAYTKVLEDECGNVDTRLTGLENITGMQLFFISNARTQCTNTNKDWLRLGMVTWMSVTPARNRVNEAMKNLEGFAKAFNCSLGSRMHPNKTCPFW